MRQNHCHIQNLQKIKIFSFLFIIIGSILIFNYFTFFGKNNTDNIDNNVSLNIVETENIPSDSYNQENTATDDSIYNTLTEEVTESNDSYVIGDFDIIGQMPELPTGCEITALTMVLNYYGFSADKITMASQYLPIASSYFYYDDYGNLYGPDLNNYFVGDPFTPGGYICGTGAIVTAADDYLEDQGSSMRAKDITGSTPEELYQLVSEDTPIVVWVTVSMVYRGDVNGWYTEDGEYVDWSVNDHGAVLIGYSDDTVTIADPISGLVEYDKETFESVFESRGNKCVILE